jgi:uncharacterized protein
MDKYKLFLNEKIDCLTYQQKLLFCLLLSDRLSENYVFFSERYNFGSIALLKGTIQNLFEELGKNTDVEKVVDVENLILDIEEITPDTEDYASIYVSFALDACTSIISTLQYIYDKNDENVIDVALYSRDTVDMFIQERDNLNINLSEIDEYIEKDICMINEKKFQIGLIEQLQRITDFSFENISFLRSQAKNPIDLSLLSGG